MPAAQNVSRAELDQHRASVSEDIANLTQLIREEGRLRSRDMESLRDDIKSLVTSTGRPQWQALGFAFGVFSFVIIVVAGVHSWNQTQIQSLKFRLADERFDADEEQLSALQSYDLIQDQARRESTSASKASLEKEIFDLGEHAKTREASNDKASTARHKSQTLQIVELQRRVNNIEQGYAPYAQQRFEQRTSGSPSQRYEGTTREP